MVNYSPGNPVGVFDSGVGGLSVLIELEKLMPRENFVFVADQKFVPYGEKTQEELAGRVNLISGFLAEQHKVKAIVIACNTATCYAIDAVREAFPDTPFIGTEPAVKPAAEYTRSFSIGVLSTPATAKSRALTRLIELHAPDKIVRRIGCNGLEDAVEEGELDSPKVRELLKKYIGLALEDGADSIVLGCTHYPFLRRQIQEIAGPIKLFDSGKAVAHQTATVLSQHHLDCSRLTHGKTLFFTTGDPGKFAYTASRLLGRTVIASHVEI